MRTRSEVQETTAVPVTRRKPRALRACSAIAAVALALTGAVIAPTAAFADSGNTVTGTVFRDFNANGTRDLGNTPKSGVPNDIGLAGVAVTATDRTGNTVGTATSNANGNYSLSIANHASADLRITFDADAPFTSSSVGKQSGSQVQFVQLGATNVNYAVTAPGDYVAPTGVPIVTTIMAAGDPKAVDPDRENGKYKSAYNSVVATPWAEQLTTQGNGAHPKQNVLATFKEVGAVNASVVDGERDRVLVAATVKRHSGLGPTGRIDTLYVIPVEQTSDKNLARVQREQPWALNLNDLKIEGTNENLNLGTAATNAARQLGNSTAAIRDAFGFENATKMGVGGMQLSTDGNTLFFVNLFDKNLYSVDLSQISKSTTTAKLPAAKKINLNLPVGQRAHAVTVHHGEVYVGVVDTGETADGDQPGKSAAAAGMNYTVLSASEADLLGNAAAAWSTVSKASLGYAKGNVMANWKDGSNPPAAPAQVKRWNTWADEWAWGSGSNAGSVAFQLAANSTTWGRNLHIYPQPALTGIAFDNQGFMQLGFSDRTDTQSGNLNWASHGTNTNTYYETVASGDILVAGPNASHTSYTLETQGATTGYPYGSDQAITRSAATATPQSIINAGHDSKEFYQDTQNMQRATTGISGHEGVDKYNHYESALGAIATVPGVEQVLTTSYDPLDRRRVTGLSWYNTTTGGAASAGYVQSCSTAACYIEEGKHQLAATFQKGGGIGSVSLLMQAAPVQIGDRVWFDADQDGIQDADEPGVAGVTVKLLDEAGKKELNTTTTDKNGNYLFTELDPLTTYQVQFTAPTTGNWNGKELFGNVPWENMTFTESALGADPQLDSNPNSTGRAIVTTGAAGDNDHSIDAGLKANAVIAVKKTLSDNSAPAGANQTFEVVFSGTDFRGDALTLANETHNLTAGGSDSRITVPVGSQLRVTENGQFTHTVLDPSGKKQGGNNYRVTSRVAPAIDTFTVENELPKPGSFTVNKELAGADLSDAEFNQLQFTVNYSWQQGATGSSGTLTLNSKNNFEAAVNEVPAGAVVQLTEVLPTVPAGYSWGTPTWKNEQSVVTEGATAGVTIVAGTAHSFTLTNTLNRVPGEFSVEKIISDEAAWAALPADATFTVEYQVNGSTEWQSLALNAANAYKASVGGLLTGDKVTLREATPPAFTAGASYEWTGYSFSNQVTKVGENWEHTVQPVGAASGSLLLTNTVGKLGTFSVTKQLDAAGTALVQPNTEFTLNYTAAGQETKSQQLTVGNTFTSAPLPVGTRVYLSELQPAQESLVPGAAWKEQLFTTADGTPLASDAQGVYLEVGDAPVVVTLTNTTEVTPQVTAEKGSGVIALNPDSSIALAEINNDADIAEAAEQYEGGESKTIVFKLVNNGPEPLRNVTLLDSTLSGDAITNLSWTLPTGATLPAVWNAETREWSAQWAETHDVKTVDDVTTGGTAQWEVGATIIGTATLTMPLAAELHTDRATVTATGLYSGTPVTASDDYFGFVSKIQVIKYDGTKDDPTVQVTPAPEVAPQWIVPPKPLPNERQDANTPEVAVLYPLNTPQTVRWVVTNTSSTWITNVDLVITNNSGSVLPDGWTADLSAFTTSTGEQGSANYSFQNSGPWPGLIPPGASFFATDSLLLSEPGKLHTDSVTVTGNPVTPETDANGVPTGMWAHSPDAPAEAPQPLLLRNGDAPIQLIDDDPFNVVATAPSVSALKGDSYQWSENNEKRLSSTNRIANNASTSADAQGYQPGETREVIFEFENTGDETLKQVVLSDIAVSGAQIDSITWNLPDDSESGLEILATRTGAGLVTEWDGPWVPGATIRGVAQLTITGTEAPHANIARVTAIGAESETPVEAEDNYLAFSGSLNVIKYDGNQGDPVLQDGDGNWIAPVLPGGAAQDANTAEEAVSYEADTTNSVKWVVTNTGSTWLAGIQLSDETIAGTPVTALDCEIPPMLAPGASFICEGTLQLVDPQHHNTITATGTVVMPLFNDDTGEPTGEYLRGLDGTPVLATVPNPEADDEAVLFTVTDQDDFHAYTGTVPPVDTDTPEAEVNNADSGLPVTGSIGLGALALVAASLLGFGLVMMVRSRRNATTD